MKQIVLFLLLSAGSVFGQGSSTKTVEVELIDRGLETKYMEAVGLIRKELVEE